MTDEESVVKTLRETINKFKAPYLTEHYGGEETTVNSIQNVQGGMQNVRNNMHSLYLIIMKVIKAHGYVPETNDLTEKSIYSVFEKNGVFPAVRADSSLSEGLSRVLYQDLIVYPYTGNNEHIDKLVSAGVKPPHYKIIVSNKVVGA